MAYGRVVVDVVLRDWSTSRFRDLIADQSRIVFSNALRLSSSAMDDQASRASVIQGKPQKAPTITASEVKLAKQRLMRPRARFIDGLH
jgi:hypothetical protein